MQVEEILKRKFEEIFIWEQNERKRQARLRHSSVANLNAGFV